MRDAIKYLFKPENLVSKKLINDYIKGANFVEYIQQQRQRYRDAMVTIQKNCDKSVETSEGKILKFFVLGVNSDFVCKY